MRTFELHSKKMRSSSYRLLPTLLAKCAPRTRPQARCTRRRRTNTRDRHSQSQRADKWIRHARAHTNTQAESNVAASGSRGGPKITLEMSVATPLRPQTERDAAVERRLREFLLMYKRLLLPQLMVSPAANSSSRGGERDDHSWLRETSEDSRTGFAAVAARNCGLCFSALMSLYVSLVCIRQRAVADF